MSVRKLGVIVVRGKGFKFQPVSLSLTVRLTADIVSIAAICSDRHVVNIGGLVYQNTFGVHLCDEPDIACASNTPAHTRACVTLRYLLSHKKLGIICIHSYHIHIHSDGLQTYSLFKPRFKSYYGDRAVPDAADYYHIFDLTPFNRFRKRS